MLVGLGPSVAGDYSIDHVAVSSDHAALKLRLRLRNAAAAPLHGASVSIRTVAGQTLLRGGVDLQSGEALNLDVDLELTKPEYGLLQRGVNPAVVIECLDSAGIPRRSFAVLLRKAGAAR